MSLVLTENTNFHAYVSPVNPFVYVKLASEREERIYETQKYSFLPAAEYKVGNQSDMCIS
jgi:hypothetical protein